MKCLFALGVCLALGACAGPNHVRDRLERAETIVAEQPDSALSLLKGIRPSALRPRALAARCALLYAEAMDKCGMDVDDDSLVRIAVKYYARHGESMQRAKAYYYLARVYENARELDTAIKSLVKAEEYVGSCNDYHLRGLVSETFGRLHLTQYHLPEARSNYEYAIACYNRCGVKLNAGLCYNQLAKIAAIENQFDETSAAYEKAKNIFRELNDTLNLLRATGMIAGLRLRMTHNAYEVKQMLEDSYQRYNQGKIPQSDYYLWSVLFINANQLDSARYFANLSLQLADVSTKRASSLFLLKDIERIAGKYKESVNYYEKYIKCIDSVYIAEQHQQVQKLERRYKNELLQANYEKLRQRNIYLIVTGLLGFFLLLFVAGAVLRQRKRIIERQRMRLAHYSKFVESLKQSYGDMKARYETLMRQQDRDDEASARILNSFRNRLEGLKCLIDNAYLYERKPAQFYEEFKKYVIINPNTQYAFTDIQYVVNKTCFGVIDYLKEHYAELTAFDLDLCSLLCFGFSQNGIRMIYEHKNAYSIYNKRSKLRKKLGLQTGQHIEDFLRDLIADLERRQRYESQ